MRLLIDTHAFLWEVLDTDRLSRTAQDLWDDANNELLISPASFWEIAIEVSIGKLRIKQSLDAFFEEQVALNGLIILQEAPLHAARLATLPLHHRDPFDRMIVAQAQCENLPLLSADAVLDNYSIVRIW